MTPSNNVVDIKKKFIEIINDDINAISTSFDTFLEENDDDQFTNITNRYANLVKLFKESFDTYNAYLNSKTSDNSTSTTITNNFDKYFKAFNVDKNFKLTSTPFLLKSSNYTYNEETYKNLIIKKINLLIENRNNINKIIEETYSNEFKNIEESYKILDRYTISLTDLKNKAKYEDFSKEINNYEACIKFDDVETIFLDKITTDPIFKYFKPEEPIKSVEISSLETGLEVDFRYSLRKQDKELKETLPYIFYIDCVFKLQGEPIKSKLYFKQTPLKNTETKLKGTALDATEKAIIDKYNTEKEFNYYYSYYSTTASPVPGNTIPSVNLTVDYSVPLQNIINLKFEENFETELKDQVQPSIEHLYNFYLKIILRIIFYQINSLKIIEIEEIIRKILLPIDKELNKIIFNKIIYQVRDLYEKHIQEWFIYGVFNTYKDNKFTEETFYQFYKFIEYNNCLEYYKYIKTNEEMVLFSKDKVNSFYHKCQGYVGKVAKVLSAGTVSETCKWAIKYLLSSKITWFDLAAPICLVLNNKSNITETVSKINKYRESNNIKLKYYKYKIKENENDKFKNIKVIYSLNYFIYDSYIFLILCVTGVQDNDEPIEYIYKLRNITTKSISRTKSFHWYMKKIENTISEELINTKQNITKYSHSSMKSAGWNKLKHDTEGFDYTKDIDTDTEDSIDYDGENDGGTELEYNNENNTKHKGKVVHNISRKILIKLGNSLNSEIPKDLSNDSIVDTVWKAINREQCYNLIHLEMIIDEMKRIEDNQQIEKTEKYQTLIQNLQKIIIDNHEKIYNILQCNGEPYSSDVITININNTEYEFILYICCNVNEYKAWLLTNHEFTNNSLTEILDPLNSLINNYFNIESKSDNSSEYPIKLGENIATSDAIKNIETYCKTTAEAAGPEPEPAAPVTSAATEPEPEAAEPEPEPEAAEPKPKPIPEPEAAEPIPAEPKPKPPAEKKIINREGKKDVKIVGCDNIPEDTEYRPRPAPGREKQGELWCNSSASYLCGKNSNIYKTQLAKDLVAVCRKKVQDCNYKKIPGWYSKDAENDGVYDPKFFTDDPSKDISEENITYCSKKT